MSSVLYLSAGNPVSPRVGMDLVSHEHIKELAGGQGHAITCISVAPGIANQPAPGVHAVNGLNVRLFVGDLLTQGGGLARAFDKIKFIFSRAVPVMAYSFKSNAASQLIATTLAQEKFDVIIVDHFYTLANLRLRQLKKSGARIVYVSHDAMLPHIMEMAKMKRGRLAKLYYRFEAWRTHVAERLLFGMASKVVHLSEYERAQSGQSNHIALLPPLYANNAQEASSGDVAEGSLYQHTVLFVGSPSHPPNAEAIRWIVDSLAPVLLSKAPGVQLAIVGGGTEAVNQASAPNVKGLGFVSTATMQAILANCICAISPVVHGRGIKVKVLEAIAAGCPVLATQESLRGFEIFPIQAAFTIDQPELLAELIVALAQSESKRHQERARVRQMWLDFLNVRQGQLLALLN